MEILSFSTCDQHWKSYDVWFLGYKVLIDKIFCHFGLFLAFYPIKNPKKNQILKKIKNKPPGDIIILHKCIKNHDFMLHVYRDIVDDRCNCFSFWAIFCTFTQLAAQKIEISKKWKTWLEISSFYTSEPKIMIICYTVPEIWCVTDVIIFFILCFFLLFYPTNSPKKSKF